MLRVSRRGFERIVLRTVVGLPVPVQEWLENVDILVEEWPSREVLREAGFESRYDILGLYRGLALPDRDAYDMVLPDRITLFRRPILAVCGSVEEVEAEVRTTLLHEIAHFLGWGEGEMGRLGVE